MDRKLCNQKKSKTKCLWKNINSKSDLNYFELKIFESEKRMNVKKKKKHPFLFF